MALWLASAVGWIASDLARRDARREASLGWGAHAQVKVVARVYEAWLREVAAEDAALRADAAAHLASTLDQELEALPETEALLRMTLAELAFEAGLVEDAERHARRALELAETTRGIGRGDLERARTLLARIHADEAG